MIAMIIVPAFFASMIANQHLKANNIVYIEFLRSN